jgi:hypothetical protein
MYFSRNIAQARNGLQFWHNVPMPKDHKVVRINGQSVAVPKRGARSLLDTL